MSNILSIHYLLVTNVIYNDGENIKRFDSLLCWNVKHCNFTLKLRTVIRDGKPITILTLVMPKDRTDLLNEFEELANKVNGLYPVYDIVIVCGGLTIKDDEEDKPYHTRG